MTHDEALELARSQAAWWVPWWPIAMIPLAWGVGRLIGVVCVAIGARSFRRIPSDAHWTERARAAVVARQLVLLGAVAGGGIGTCVTLCGPLAVVGLPTAAALGAVAGLVGALGARGRLDDVFGLPRPARAAVGALGVWLVLLPALPFTLVTLALVARIDDTFAAVTSWALGGLLLAGWIRGASFSVLRGLGAAEASRRIEAIVARAAAKLGRTPPDTYVLAARIANAFAFPLSGHLVFTSSAVAALDDDALEAVTLHELGHLAESRRVVAFRALRVASFYLLALTPIAYRLHPMAVVGLVAIVLAIAIVGRRLSVRFEQAADAVAHAHADEGAYARALEQLYRVNLMPAVTRGRGTHPHLYDRLVAAGVAPSYPRPAPPARSVGMRLAVVLAFAVVVAAVRVGTRALSGDLAVAISDDLVALAHDQRAISPARAVPIDVLVLDEMPSEPARAWLAIDQVQAGACEGALVTIASGPVEDDVRVWVESTCR